MVVGDVVGESSHLSVDDESQQREIHSDEQANQRRHAVVEVEIDDDGRHGQHDPLQAQQQTRRAIDPHGPAIVGPASRTPLSMRITPFSCDSVLSLMTEGFRQGHYILGIEGLALLRAGARRDYDGVDTRTEEMLGIISRLNEPPYSKRRDLPEVGVEAGYAQWADDYDDPGNDTIALEEPVVRGLLEQLPDGPVLDAACGTGRQPPIFGNADMRRLSASIQAMRCCLAPAQSSRRWTFVSVS